MMEYYNEMRPIKTVNSTSSNAIQQTTIFGQNYPSQKSECICLGVNLKPTMMALQFE